MDKHEIIIRPARQSDTEDVLELTRHIWEGHDYVPYVWADWLADGSGRLLVAEYQGNLLGFSKLTCLSDEDWWMEGLRVHPAYQGHGIASRLTEASLQAWLQIGQGTVRLTTAPSRLPIHHLCERLGFTKIGEITAFVAPALEGSSGVAAGQPFTAVSPGEVSEALAYAQGSPVLALGFGLIDLGWCWAPPRQTYLESSIQNGMAWWWQHRQGLLIGRKDEDDDRARAVMVQPLVGALAALAACLLDSRQLAAALRLPEAAWMAPQNPDLLPILAEAGFHQDWDETLVLYARQHPSAGG
jgi:GNAT superfamily N-acetyltransferase